MDLHTRFLEQIVPKFTNNVPKSIRKKYRKQRENPSGPKKNKLVAIEIMLMILFAATVTGTSIQATTDHMAEVQAMQGMMDPNKAPKFSKQTYRDNIDLFKEKLPDPQLVRNSLKQWKPKNIRSRSRKIIREFIRELKYSQLVELIHGKWADDGVSAAFDLTEVKYYGQDRKENPYTISSKDYKGSKFCHAYLTLQVICPGFSLILDVEPIYDDSEPMGELMTKMLIRAKRNHLKINNIYVDRGFYRAEIFETFNDELSRRLILPAKRTDSVKNAITSWYKKNGYKAGHQKVTIRSSKTGHEQEYILIFKPKSLEERKKWREKKDIDVNDDSLEHVDRDFLYFCINDLPHHGKSMADVFDQIAQEYTSRWGIETGYRVSKQVWAWTTSTSYQLRYWLMWCSVLVYNIWILENLELIEEDVFHENPRKRKTSEEIVKEIKETYNCCGIPTIEEVKRKQERLKRSKLPASERSTKKFPSRPWKPRPKLKMRQLSNRILIIIIYQINTWYGKDEQLQAGYDPPT